MTKIINIFAGPGAGKSTVAAGLFYLMKTEQIDVELVTEYAKDLVWEGREEFLREPDQLYIFAQQYRRVSRLVGKVEYVITDSPLLLSLVYQPTNPQTFMERLVLDVWDTFNNENFVLSRTTNFNEDGRAHSEEESREIDSEIQTILDMNGFPYRKLPMGPRTPHVMLEWILR